MQARVHRHRLRQGARILRSLRPGLKPDDVDFQENVRLGHPQNSCGGWLVGAGRVELPTPSMSTRCSTTELRAYCHSTATTHLSLFAQATYRPLGSFPEPKFESQYRGFFSAHRVKGDPENDCSTYSRGKITAPGVRSKANRAKSDRNHAFFCPISNFSGFKPQVASSSRLRAADSACRACAPPPRIRGSPRGDTFAPPAP